MALKTLFSASEQSDLLLAAYKVTSDGDAEGFLAKAERIFLDKLYESSEIERLLKLRT
jgi:hypothetical protein